LKVNQYTVGYETLLLENVSFEINAKDKVAIVGANGTGKTTLLRDIYENKLPTIEINEKINAMFFSQLQNKLPTESTTILDEFFNLGFQSYDEIDGFLSKYGFEREILSNRMDALSGGEKMILQIAKLSVSSANMLLLDEPTSHLDTYSQIALEQAIANYNGTVLMISHDFYSVVNCVDYILLIEDKTIRRVSMRKFRKMIYERHFDKDYLEIEKKKKDFETRIAQALQNRNFELAKSIAEELEKLLVMMK
jgi:ATP-binding cassette subfamily F protein 3